MHYISRRERRGAESATTNTLFSRREAHVCVREPAEITMKNSAHSHKKKVISFFEGLL